MRDADGNIVPLPEGASREKDPSPSAEAVFAGVKEKVPRHVGQLVRSSIAVSCMKTNLFSTATTHFELG